MKFQLDPQSIYDPEHYNDYTPEKKLIVDVIFRAFWDGLGHVGSSGDTKTRGRKDARSGRNFIRCCYKIEWGKGQWLDAEELCIIATGNNRLVKMFQQNLNNTTLKRKAVSKRINITKMMNYYG